jgi:hypothetical protein
MAGVAALVAGGAVWALQAGGPAGIDLANAESGARATESGAPLVAPLEQAGLGGTPLASRSTQADSAALLKVLAEIREELRALRAANGGALAPVARASADAGATGAGEPDASRAGVTPSTRPDTTDIEAAIRAGEALALGREVARFRHYLEQQRHEESESVSDGDAEVRFDAQQAVSAYDRALADLGTVRSFRELMAFYRRWDDDDHVSVIYPKWDR